jgi:hypothetical protein
VELPRGVTTAGRGLAQMLGIDVVVG